MRSGTGSSGRPPATRFSRSTTTSRTKLDDIVGDEWRTPDEYLEPLTGSPYSKLRIGPFRLACSCRHEDRLLVVYSIEHRSGAYKPGDDD